MSGFANPPSRPQGAWTLEQLREHLQWAIELEHATIPPYLYAMYTLRPDANPEAYYVIRSVVVEEMLHMTLAANLLNAVGRRPVVDSPGFIPDYPTALPFTDPGFEVRLLAFSPEAIDMFLTIEAPEQHFDPNPGPGPEGPYRSIGEFYDGILEGLRELTDDGADPRIFTGNPTRQVGPAQYYSAGGKVVVVRDYGSAREAVRIVKDQGEGMAEDVDVPADDNYFGEPTEVAHYYRFNEIKLGRRYAPDQHLPSEPPRGDPLPVDWTAVYPVPPTPRSADYPAGTAVRAASDAFNLAYSRLLRTIERGFTGQPEALADAVPMMFELKYRVIELIRNPFPGRPGFNAGPTFEYMPEPHRA